MSKYGHLLYRVPVLLRPLTQPLTQHAPKDNTRTQTQETLDA